MPSRYLNNGLRLVLGFGSVCLLILSSSDQIPSLVAQQTESKKPASNQDSTAEPKQSERSTLPAARSQYKGRKIAQTMHFSGAQWLTRDSREREERCSLLLTNLGLRPGQTVCDMGCGNGYYSLKIAQMVGQSGRILGVDVQSEMLELLLSRMEEQGIDNVTPILGSYHDPRLPQNSCDLILLVDVYHEFSHPELMLQAMRRALKPGGRIALVEYRSEDPDVPIKPLHKMSKEQIMKEFPPNGFRLDSEFDELPWQHVMFFERSHENER